MKTKTPCTNMDTAFACRHSEDPMPKLRKNKKIDSKWGHRYYTAVKEAVFGVQSIPYMPSEPPPSLSEDVSESEPLHVCRQCKDCFRFLTSFEDHNSRRSWILGFWCQHCFLTICEHSPKGATACPDCTRLDREKRTYLRNKGFKSQRLGATRVFYNQCQFFAHLKTHNMTLVDICDLILMPLPTDLGTTWPSAMEEVCEALMEHAFLTQDHVMDWLRRQKVDKNWWQFSASDVDSESNVISKILANYQGRQLFGLPRETIKEEVHFRSHPAFSNTNSRDIDMEILDKKSETVGKDTGYPVRNIDTPNSDQNVSENEDNPYMPADIAFVDCGPTPKCYEPDTAAGFQRKRYKTLYVKSEQDVSQNWNTSNQSSASLKGGNEKTKIADDSLSQITYGNSTMTPRNNAAYKKHAPKRNLWKNYKCPRFVNGRFVIPESNVDSALSEYSVPKKVAKLCTAKSNSSKQLLQTAAVQMNPTILTFQNPRNLDISEIISQISPHLGNSKKIVLIGADPDRVHKSARSVMDVPTIKRMTKIVKEGDKGGGGLQRELEKMARDQQQSSESVVHHDGRKYVIKRSTNSSPLHSVQTLMTDCHDDTVKLVNESASETAGGQQFDTVQDDTSPLTPSPSPSESSVVDCKTPPQKLTPASLKASSFVEPSEARTLRDVDNRERLSFRTDEKGDCYLNITVLDGSWRDGTFVLSDSLLVCRQNMIGGFQHLPYAELKARLDHLRQVAEHLKMANNAMGAKMVTKNARSIETLENALKESLERLKDTAEGAEKDELREFLALFDDWQAEAKESTARSECPTCEKPVKPKSYVPGFSEPADDDSAYCVCYKQVCHTCATYQGSASRFLDHRNYHDQQEPFACPDCRTKFPCFKTLKAHTWSSCFHLLKRLLLGCAICELNGFQDIESLARHFAVMHTTRKLACEVCRLVLSTSAEYEKHHEQTHPSVAERRPVRLVACTDGQCVNRCEDYMSHLHLHSSIREIVWHKCPLCSFSLLNGRRVPAIIQSHLHSKHFGHLAELANPSALSEMLPYNPPRELSKSRPDALPRSSSTKFVNADAEPSEDGTVVPRIINTRTITSEVFERGSQETDEDGHDCPVNSVLTNSRIETFESRVGSGVCSLNVDDAASPGTTDARSEPVGTSTPRNTEPLPKILDVRSMLDAESKDANAPSATDVVKAAIEDSVQLRSTTRSVSKKAAEANSEIDSSGDVSTGADTSKDVDSSTEYNLTNSNGAEESAKRAEPADARTFTLGSDSNDQHLSSDGKSDATKVSASGSQTPVVAGRLKVKDLEELCEVTIADTDARSRSPLCVSKPPPLARIPQHLLTGTDAKPEPEKKSPTASAKHKTNRKRPCRIALNGPTTLNERPLDYRCHLCGETINTSWQVVRAHFDAKHSDGYKLSIVTPRLLKISREFVNGGYREVCGSRKRRVENGSAASKRRRRWTPRKYSDPKGSNSPGLGLCVTRETAKDADGNIKCKKCDECCKDMPGLREHIASNHRIKGRYLICLECGENFVVAPSLQMHLKAFHGIEDPITYMAQNTLYAPDSVDDLDGEGRTTVANQCHVCMAVFEDKAAVDKHLRVHGMAFLKRKRIEARNALRSPEKRVEEEKPSPSPAKEAPKAPQKRDNPSETILEKINATM